MHSRRTYKNNLIKRFFYYLHLPVVRINGKSVKNLSLSSLYCMGTVTLTGRRKKIRKVVYESFEYYWINFLFLPRKTFIQNTSVRVRRDWTLAGHIDMSFSRKPDFALIWLKLRPLVKGEDRVYSKM